jgi:hypothetical protein
MCPTSSRTRRSGRQSLKRPTWQTLDPGQRRQRTLDAVKRLLLREAREQLGKLYRRTGDDAKAAEHLTAAATMFREMDMTFWLEKAGAELGGVER